MKRRIDVIEEQARRLIAVYRRAEIEIEKAISDAIIKIQRTGTGAAQLAVLQTQRKNVKSILADLTKANKQWTEQAVTTIYLDAVSEARAEVQGVTAVVSSGFNTVHQQAAQVLADTTYSRLADVVTTVGRKTLDIFKVIQLDASISGSALGYETWRQTKDKILKRLEEHGVTGFVDKAGKQWGMETYSEMLARTALMDVHIEGKTREFIELGEDLVIVSSHPQACELCRPFEGKILSITGSTKGYTSLESAKAAGLFHPRCRHNFELYIP